ncbi:cyclic peptide export ABC transporter [Burkholderia gladioli]|uniref:cyclic peptide export ABC transporter n=1 Tax=Burkholderia gladioli TaxID=28095 RepID=UPI00163F4751|nr:cyclic peptide export ABC transporter [Burkholderia gladioli]
MMLKFIAMLFAEGPVLFSLASIASAISGVATMGILVSTFVAMEGNAGVRWWHFLLYGVLVVVTRVMSRSVLALITRRAVMTLRVNLARQIVGAPLDQVERTGHSRLFASMAQDVTRIGEAVPNAVGIFANLVFLLVCFIYLGVLSIDRLAVVIGMVVIGVLVHLRVSQRIARCMRDGRNAWDQLVMTFDLLVNGIKELQLNGQRRAQMLDVFTDNARELKLAWQRQSIVFNFGQGFSQAIFFLALGMVIFDLHGNLLAQGVVMQYALSLVYMIGPLRDIVATIPGLLDASVAYERIERMGYSLKRSALPEAGQGRPDQDRFGTAWQRIVLRGVVHRYASRGESNRPFHLGPLDLELRRGDVVFIVGRNGSGKTTLAKILTGLYVPDEGGVYLDETPVSDANRAAYRELFSAIFSDFVLFERMLAAPGDGLDGRVEALLRSLRIHEKVGIRHGRLSTVTALSLGERKRLALLSSYLEERPVYLFDEWAADQDPVFKSVFYEQILPELRTLGRTVIVVSHDDRYFRVGDTLIDLDRLPGSRQQERAAMAAAGAARVPRWLAAEAARDAATSLGGETH